MKRSLVILLGLGLLFTSCQQRELLPTSYDGEEETVNITVYAADAISVRSNSASGGLTNVSDLSLRYILSVYDDSDALVSGSESKVTDGNGAVTFAMKLGLKKTYKFVVWADFVESVAEGEDPVDYRYDTSNFPTVTYNDLDEDDEMDIAINDESYDAYYACESKTIGGGDITLTLGRPFAKLRLVTTDWDSTDCPESITLTYDKGRYTTFNALTGAVSGEADDVTFTADLTATSPYDEGVDGTEGTYTLAVDYLFAEEDGQTAHISYTAKKGGEELNSLVIARDIPLQRNYLTTVSGALLTTDDSFNFGISIGDDFETGPTYVNGSFTINSENTIKYNGKTYYTLEIGASYALKLTPSFTGLAEGTLDSAVWTWESSSDATATVAAGTEDDDLGKGIVTGVATGFVTVTATWYDEANDTYYSCSGYLCVIDPSLGGIKVENNTVTVSIDDTKLTGYWEEPFGTEQTLTWEIPAEYESDNIITLSEDGTIKALNFGTTYIKVSTDVEEEHIDSENGYSSELTLTVNVVKGYYNDTFTDESNCNWALNTSHVSNGASKTYYTSALGENYWQVDINSTNRADIGHLTTSSNTTYGSTGNHDVYLDPTAYPIVCFRLDDLNDKSGYTCNISIDTSGKDDDTHNDTYSGSVVSNNAWTHKYSCSDGSAIVYFDLGSKTFPNGGSLTTVGDFTTFAIKYADITMPGDVTEVSYRFFWFKTFASTTALESYLNEWSTETGITY